MDKPIIHFSNMEKLIKLGFNSDSFSFILQKFINYSFLKYPFKKAPSLVFELDCAWLDSVGAFMVLEDQKGYILINLNLFNEETRNSYPDLLTNIEKRVLFIILHEVGHYFNSLLLFNKSKKKDYYCFWNTYKDIKNDKSDSDLNTECFAEMFAVENLDFFYTIYINSISKADSNLNAN